MKSYKKILLVIIAVSLVFALVFPKLTRGQFVTNDIPQALSNVWDKIEKAYDKVQSIVGAELANRTFEMFFNSLAYDVATELAEGGAGGKPQFRIKSIGDSLKAAGGAAVGEFIGTLSEKNFEELGVNLCSPNAAQIKLTLSLSLIDEEAPPEPACDWRRIQRDWSQFGNNLSADLIKFQLDPKRGATSTKAFFDSFSLEQSDLGAYAILFQAKEEAKQEAVDASKLSAEECQGYLDKATPITNEVITHCSVIQSMGAEQWFMAWYFQAVKQWQQKNAATNKKLGDIIKDAAGKFYNTFTSKLMNNWIKKGMWSLYDLEQALDGDSSGSGYRGGLIEALRGEVNIRQPRNVDIFKDFKKIDIIKLDDYSFMDDFSVCPPEKDLRKPDNCVVGTDLVQAINAKKTLNEAINEGLIDPNTPLISPEDLVRNTSDNCYKDGLCYKDLIKLRKANVIPIGWEIAAERSSVAAPVSLAEAIECFEDRPNSNCIYNNDMAYAINGVPHNPFYHLIDGDWVLKAPKSSCDALVYSPVLESSQSSNRQQYCADLSFCLREDQNGNCLDGQYGYCTKSENIWRFNGDMCDDGDIFNGCLTFDSSYVENPGSYIESSLQYCTADQAGCRRYSQEKTNDDSWLLQNINTDPNDLFLNRRADICEEEFAGCSEYIVLAANRGVNMIPNGDFEMATTSDATHTSLPAGFENGFVVAGEGMNGSNAVSANISGGTYGNPPAVFRFKTAPNTNYTVSAYVKRGTGTGRARIAINSCHTAGGVDDGGITSPDGSFPDVTNDDGTLRDRGVYDEANVFLLSASLSPTEYQRFGATFNSGNSVECQVYLGNDYATLGDHYFDNLQIEITADPVFSPSPYSDYGVGGTVYMGGNTTMCEWEDVGCQGYYPVNGDPMIPGIITQDDLCPNECVGYATFAQQPTIFDVMESTVFPVPVEYYNFIPNTANSCPDSEIGCEEFTNLDEVAQGGEGKEYYSFLRQCVQQDLATTYFTWEGNDTAGYQIITRPLLTSDEVTILPDGHAPCTNINPGGNVCQDGATGGAAICGDETPANPNDDPDVNSNCREYFDTPGRSYFRFQDRVIYATDDCHDYKRTSTGQIYKAVPNQSIVCQAENDGCKSYYGNSANNLRQIFLDNFELNMNNWSSVSGVPIGLSQESLNQGGQSLKTQATGVIAKNLLASNTKINYEKEYEVSFWMKSNASLSNLGITMELDDGPNSGSFSLVDASDPNFVNIQGGTWKNYKTSAYLSSLPVNLNSLTQLDLVFSFGSSVITDVYIDNVSLKEVSTSLTLVKDSWVTPVSCDSPYEGYHLGCQSYVDTNNTPYDLKSFTRLCSEDVIGCISAIDTQNSSNPFLERFNEGDLSEITVPRDDLVFLVPDADNYCPQVYKGCSALGLPDDSVNPSSYETVYKMNNPDNYDVILCESEGLDCEEFNSAKGTYYFKIVSQQESCSYLQNVLINDGTNDNLINGWFINSSISDGTNIGCSDDGDGIVEQSDYDFIWDHCIDHPDVHTEADCVAGGWTWLDNELSASCPPDKNLCTAFRDPQDPVGCDPNIQDRNIDGYCSDLTILDESSCISNNETWTPACDEYYYYKNNKIDEKSCNGQVDRNSGCILLTDANNWNGDHSELVQYYDSDQSYDINVSKNQPYSPISCNPEFDPNCSLDANILVKATKDRQCAEWLTCKSSTAVFNKETNDYDLICDGLDACVEYDDDDSSVTSCKKWADYDESNIEALTASVYQTRTTGQYNHLSWGDYEYTGYSVPDMLPVSQLVTYDFGDEENPAPRLVYSVWDSVAINTRFYDACVNASDPEQPIDNISCSTQISGQTFYGDCEDGICWVNPIAESSEISAFPVETRGYALQDSPFPSAIKSGLDKLQAYSSAKVCDADDNGCEASFTRVTYGDAIGSATVFYYPKGYETPISICTMGNVGETNCYQNSDCDSAPDRYDGQCAPKTKEETFFNWQGICMEYDKSQKLVKNNKDSYSCNLWYPTDTIDGVTNLFNNFREAGYYAEDGNDALFCAVAEPFEFDEDTYYCGHVAQNSGLNVCTVLIKVPRGAMVSLTGMQNYGNEIVNGYLRQGTYLDHAFDDPINLTSQYPGTIQGFDTNFENGFGVDWIERRDVGPDPYYNPDQTNSCSHYNNYNSLSVISWGDGYNSFFQGSDFSDDPTDLSIPYIPFNNIAEIFNTGPTSHAAGPIDVYYYDEEVTSNGTFNYETGILVPGAERYLYGVSNMYDGNVLADFGKHCDDKCRDDWGVWYCPDGWHEALVRRKYRGSHCSTGGPREHWSYRYCNPGDHNYYVKATYPTTIATPSQCAEEDCGGTERGEICLNDPGSVYFDMLNANASNFIWEYSWLRPYDINPDPAVTTYRDRMPIWTMVAVNMPQYCYNNPNCLFIYCIEKVSAPNDYCSEYGEIRENFDADGNPTSITIVQCMDNFYERDPDNGPLAYKIKDPGDNIDPNFNEPLPVDLSLVDEAYNLDFGCYDMTNPLAPVFDSSLTSEDACSNVANRSWLNRSLELPQQGCLESSIGADCSTDTAMPSFNTCSWYKRGNWLTPGYCSSNDLVSVDGSDCTNLECFQQCRIVTQLDSEGDRSWVRTDIWWRNKQGGVRLPTVDTWISYYYHNPSVGYGTPSTAVDWDSINDPDVPDAVKNQGSFDTYGAARASISNEKVLARAPLDATSNFTDYLTVHFFGYVDNTAVSADPVLDAWNLADNQMQQLFYRAYNFEWREDLAAGGYTYTAPDPAHLVDLRSVELPFGNSRNTFAGPEFDPIIYKACENKLCPVKDGNQNILSYREGITVNNSNDGRIDGHESLFVALKFFYMAHPDHMPVVDVGVVWGDQDVNLVSSNPGKYKNNLETCDPSWQPYPPSGYEIGFGGTSGACQTGYKVFYNDYEYDADPADPTIGHPCTGATYDSGAGPTPNIPDASCFRPGVRVVDRWGRQSTVYYDDWIVIHKQ